MASLETATDLLGQLREVLGNGSGQVQDQTVRRQALRLSRLLVTSLEEPIEKAFEINFLPTYTLCCRTAVQLGLFSIIAENDGPVTATQLAKKAKAEHLLIVRTMRVLCGMSLVQETGPEKYGALPITKVMASKMTKTFITHFWDQGASSLLKFPQYLQEKGFQSPSDPVDGLFQYAFNTKQEAFQYWHQFPEVLDNVNTLMQGIRISRPSWVDWYPIEERILKDVGSSTDPDSVILVDIAGGRGHDLEYFQKKFPQAPGRLVLEDLPAVIDDIKELDGAIRTVKADFFTPQPVHGARAYYFSHIFHDWSDKPCEIILRNLKPALKRGYSKLLLNDFILPDVGASLLQAGFDIEMMAMHAGVERTKTQWRDLLTREGFRVVKFWLPPGGDGEGIVEAELA